LKEKFYNNEPFIKTDKNLQINKKNFTLKEEYIQKNFYLQQYKKRIFNENKTETRPITINELHSLK